MSRFQGARNHNFILKFFKQVKGTSESLFDFVIDLLNLKVPQLFAVEDGTDELTERKDIKVAHGFSSFLQSCFTESVIEQSFLMQITSLLVSMHVFIPST